ncbi:late embryogenesis abundant protein Lea14-A-like [Iris pallida]|uniref:Late embryogenesis abundant protein Lea14-A-like n=1 Tax=Iris pallida TaxID=29817 RepID=A0AAX6G408_IRIPA|nr:late embryogenesis abundant protein Lea14-A-like [Iris pallida]
MSGLINKAKEFVADKIAHLPKPEATVTDVSVKTFSRKAASFNGEVSVTNPYSHSLPICEIAYTLKSNDKEIASGTVPDPGSLKASDVTMLVVPVDVPYDFMISLMRDFGRDWDIDYELIIGLTIDLPIIGEFTIPLSSKGEIKLPTLSDLF